MKKTLLRKLILPVSVVTLVGVLTLPLVVKAEEQTMSPDQSVSSTDPEKETLRKNLRELKAAEQKAKQQKMLEAKEAKREAQKEKRQQFCERRKAKLLTTLGRISSRGERQLEFIDKVVTLVKTYYEKNNLEVEGYDALLADIAAKRPSAASAVDDLEKIDTSIDCTAEQPGKKLGVFRGGFQKKHTSMQAYRQSVKKLVLAVKSVVESSNKVETTR